ncbi:hypothetical protein BBK14_20400 [Parafrankia soli]|uniref:Uncharacterized protein n=1 Tax=Parafrankia soli TaxID=2599596 RepID=A0A1S1Q0R0_9ACTN|nr:hypothetical protein [Parafrankia soli]OHV27560.1 hypothetical protein BBK14_20400 [Parafrankia soli]
MPAAVVEAGLDRLVVEKAFASALRNTCGPRWPTGDVDGELDDVLAFAYAERRRDVFTTALRSKSTPACSNRGRAGCASRGAVIRVWV